MAVHNLTPHRAMFKIGVHRSPRTRNRYPRAARIHPRLFRNIRGHSAYSMMAPAPQAMAGVYRGAAQHRPRARSPSRMHLYMVVSGGVETLAVVPGWPVCWHGPPAPQAGVPPHQRLCSPTPRLGPGQTVRRAVPSGIKPSARPASGQVARPTPWSIPQSAPTPPPSFTKLHIAA
eukprot:357499-Chlamydomonas_euryale.AAC.12